MYARRSTRATRPTTSVVTKGGRRAGAGTGHGHKRSQNYDRIRAAQERGPVRKWFKVQRPPAPHIRFGVEKWVLETDLTDAERQAMMASRTDRAEEEQSIVEKAEQQQRGLQQQHGPNEQTMHGPVKADERKKSGDANDATSTEAETPASAV